MDDGLLMEGAVAAPVPVVSNDNRDVTMDTKHAATTYCVPAHAAVVILDGKPADALVTVIDGDSDRAGALGSSLAGTCTDSSVTNVACVCIAHTC